MRFVRRNAEQPGLELTIALERVQTLDHRQKSFLANLFDVFGCEIRTELKHEAPGRRVIEIEQFVPAGGIAAQAACKQLGLGAHRRKITTRAALWRADWK